MEKKLFEIDGYRIWAYTYDEAYQNYLQILRFQIMNGTYIEKNIEGMIEEINDNTEWLESSEEDLNSILELYFQADSLGDHTPNGINYKAQLVFLIGLAADIYVVKPDEVTRPSRRGTTPTHCIFVKIKTLRVRHSPQNGSKQTFLLAFRTEQSPELVTPSWFWFHI